MEPKALAILEAASDKQLAKALIDTFKEVERNYFLRSWKTSELDAGHFVEAARRFVDYRLAKTYVPIGSPLPNFNDAELKRVEKLAGPDAYRLHIPRSLLAIYGLRNKRGVGHLGLVSPNYLDATYILATCKWVLGEFLRAESTLNYDETNAVVEAIVERPVPGIWDAGNVRRILASDLPIVDQILFLLLVENPQSEQKLLASIEYKNQAYFRKKLRELHAQRLIEYGEDGTCTLSPKGNERATEIALRAAP